MPEINNIPTRQYIGPKIVPHVATPVQWDSTKQYDALSIVMDEGNTYVARYIVPAGIPLTNDEYWVKFASWNAQVAVLQDTVDLFDERIDTVETLVPAEETARIAADEALQTAINDEVTARTSADTSLQDSITAEITARTSADTTLQDNIDAEEAARIAADNTLRTEIGDEVAARTNADAIMQGSIDTLEEILPASAFSSVNTVKAALENLSVDSDITFESGMIPNKIVYAIFTFPKDKYRIDFKPVDTNSLVPGSVATVSKTLVEYALSAKPFFAFNVNPTDNFIYNGTLYGTDWSASATSQTGFYGTTAEGDIKFGRGGSFVTFANNNNCVNAVPAWQPLIVNNIPQVINNYVTFTEPNPYPLVAVDDDNFYVCMTFCRFGNFVGMTLAEYQSFCINRNWPNVCLFDGGGSNQMVTGDPFMKLSLTVSQNNLIDRPQYVVCVVSERE